MAITTKAIVVYIVMDVDEDDTDELEPRKSYTVRYVQVNGKAVAPDPSSHSPESYIVLNDEQNAFLMTLDAGSY